MGNGFNDVLFGVSIYIRSIGSLLMREKLCDIEEAHNLSSRNLSSRST